MDKDTNAMRPIIGLMSGTSADGIDAAILHSDGLRFARTGITASFAYDPSLRDSIFDAVHDPVAFMADTASFEALSDAITDAHSAAVMAILDQMSDDSEKPCLIGFHGQTIFHEPDADTTSPLGRCTIQLGSGQLLADATSIDVVHDVRRADMAAGGQGAPLAPIYHAALITKMDAKMDDAGPAVIINIGGVANLTYVGTKAKQERNILGFDTGPGNALMDDYMRTHFNQPFDDGGKIAAKGKIDNGFVARVMQDDFFARSWPKSLDRGAFAHIVVNAGLDDLAPHDAVASLAALTVASITYAVASLPEDTRRIYIAGGGRLARPSDQPSDQRV